MHEPQLYLLAAGCAFAVGLFAYFHARRYWEGLPPVLDAFVSMVGFTAMLGAIEGGNMIGGWFGHPHAGSVVALAVAIIVYRSVRTWIGTEQIRYRAARVRKPKNDDSGAS